MKYTAPEGKFILFDNSDVIVASPHDLACHSSRDANAWCTAQGDSTQPNECGLNGRNCTMTSTCDDWPNYYACALDITGATCSAENQNFYNAGPYIPQ